MGPLAVAAAALVCAACLQSEQDLGPFEINLALDVGIDSYCHSEECEDYGMSCGAVMAIRMLDLDRGAPVVDECEEIAALEGANLCGLANLNPNIFLNIPPDQMWISVAVWRPGVLPDNRCPNVDIFDRLGVPLVGFSPRPAFGGAVYFDVGTNRNRVTVPLSCTDAPQLDQEECTPGGDTTLVRAQVDDIQTALDITSDQAKDLTVGVAAPRQVPGTPGETEYIIENSETIDLTHQVGPIPSFTAEVDESLGTTVCAVVLDSAPESTVAATCYDVAESVDPLELRGVLVEKPTLDPILAAMSLEQFPASGLVMGRVVDHTGAPLAGVQLSAGLGTVEYLDAEVTAIGGTETSTSGFFISRDAPFASRWTAQHTEDGRREQGEPRAGLVRQKVSAIVVRMEPP